MTVHTTVLHCNELTTFELQNDFVLQLNTNETTAWLYEIDNFDSLPDKLIDILSGEEKNKMLRYRQQADRCRFLYAHAAKRILCAAYTGMVVSDLEFAESDNKKPYLVNSDIKFNLSHSGNFIALIFQQGNECGIDTEKIRPDFDMDYFAYKNYHSHERNNLLKDEDKQSRTLFFQYWARKEAWLKTTGIGIFGGLPYINTSTGDNRILVPVHDMEVTLNSHYYLRSFEFRNNYFCLCTTLAESKITILNFNVLLAKYL